jgi:hypothetical protein
MLLLAQVNTHTMYTVVFCCAQTGSTAGPQSSPQAHHTGGSSHNSSVLNSIETGAAGSLTEEEAVVQAIQVCIL